MDPDRKLLIFVATYNEAENVELLFDRILRLELGADILFLDDNSPDNTGRIIDRIAELNPNVYAIHRAGKLGIGSAHSAGIAWAFQHGYQTLVTMDCDFTHEPERIVDFLREAENHDIVVGSRYMQAGSLRTWNRFRRTLTRVGHFLTTGLLRMPFDATGAFRMYRLDRISSGVFELIHSTSYSFFFESLYICWLNGARIHEIPIELPARTYGHSKMSWKDALRSTILLCRLFVKTRVDRKALLYAEPCRLLPRTAPIAARPESNAWWCEKKERGAAAYDLIAAFYRKFIVRPSLTNAARKHFFPGAEVLHAGCAGGQVDRDIAQTLRISAMDISEEALAMYRERQPRNDRLIHGSVFDIPAPAETYDGVYHLGGMGRFTQSEIRRVLGEFNRVLKPNGRVLLFWPPSFKRHPDEIGRARARGQAREWLAEAGFSLVDFHCGWLGLFTQAVVVGQKQPAFFQAMDAAIQAESAALIPAGAGTAART